MSEEKTTKGFGRVTERRGKEPANGVFITPEDLQNLLKTAISEATKLNPLEQRKLDEELQREKRKNAMMRQLGEIEERTQREKRDRCSHMRFPAGSGRNAGHSAPRGAMGAEWCTGGQAYQDGTAMIICQRCSATWLFRPDPSYYTAIIQNGLLSEPPPPEELTICPGCFELKPACRCKELYLLTKTEEVLQQSREPETAAA